MDISYLVTGLLVVLFVFLANLIFFLGLPFLTVVYLKNRIAKDALKNEVFQ